MAFDTQEERLSALGFNRGGGAFVFPGDSLDQQQRQASLWNYAGLLVATTTPFTGFICVSSVTGQPPYAVVKGRAPDAVVDGRPPYVEAEGRCCS